MRSWLPSSEFVCVQRLCALQFDNHRQHSWVVRFLSSACEVPASNKSLCGNNNLKRLCRHSEQESQKHHSNIKEEHFLTIYVYTSRNRVLFRVLNHKETWHSGREFVCREKGTCCETGCPKFCTKGIVRKCQPGHLLENNQELTWWPKRSWLPPSSYWTTETAVSNMKVTDCKAEVYSICLRYARSLRQNNPMCPKKIWSTLVRFSEQEREKNHSNTKNERFLPVLCIRVQTECFVDLRYSREYSSVVEHSPAVREVPGPHPGVT